MPKQKLTYKFVETVKSDNKDIIYWDTDRKGAGLGLRVYPTGLKKYLFNYRNNLNKQSRITISCTNTLTLDEARKKSLELLIQIKNGEDPVEEKDEYKKSITFNDLTELFLAYKKNQIREVTLKEYKRIISRELKPKWSDYKARDISRKMVIGLLDEIQTVRQAKTLAVRTKALIHQIFSFAVQREHIGINPTTDIKLNIPYIRKTRYLSENEISLFLTKIDSVLEPQVANILKLILLTGQRPGEVAKLEWKEISNDIWTLPSSKAKNKMEHSIPIVGLAKEILDEIKSQQITNSDSLNDLPIYVFPSLTGSHIKWFTHACARLVKKMKVETFTPRDLRRTAATHIRGLGFAMETIKKILNHKEASSNVTAIYNRYNELKEMKEAFKTWSDRLIQIQQGKRFHENVISICEEIDKLAA